MPYRFAAVYVIALIGITIVAFWPGYFAKLGSAPWGFHLHGITASLWMLLLAFQSWSIHSKRRSLHRIAGIGSLGLFPLFMAGNVAVLLSMARATPTDAFYQIYGARLGILDATTPLLLGWLYYHALAERRNVQLHARYLLATPLMLIMPIVSRLVSAYVPGLVIHGPAEFPLFVWGVRISNVVALACAAGLYATAPRFGRPFLVTGMVLVAQAVLFETVAVSSAWQTAFVALGRLPTLPMLALTAVVGAAISWLGWKRLSSRTTVR